ncbi:MAG: VapE domain-containing protein [Pseudomonadota bacterium]
MTRNDFENVGRAALDAIDTLLAAWFPQGVVAGAEFCIGSRDGEAGQSLRIRLTGAKAGVWSDFSSDGAAGGDLISLYAYIHSLDPGPACAELAQQVGVDLSTPKGQRGGAKRAMTSTPTPRQKDHPPAQADKGVDAVPDKKARAPWNPILPVPDDAGPQPKAHLMRGRPQAVWEYRNTAGRLLGLIYRFVRSDGKGKEVLPCVYAQDPVSGQRDWRWMAFPEPRPLYLFGEHRPEVPLLIVEGEKCADAANAKVGDTLEVISWPGGGKAVAKCDWSQIRGRQVILWADADAKLYPANHECAGEIMPEHKQPGMLAMSKLAAILRAQDCEVFFVDIPGPGEVPDGWDVADLIAGGGDAAAVIEWTTKLRAETLPPTQTEECDDVPAWVAEQLETVPAELPAGARPRANGAIRAMLFKNERGYVKGCRENVFTVMQHDAKLIGLVGLDLFSGLQVKRRVPPWPSEPGEWTESDDFRLGLYMAQHHDLVLAAIGDIERGVAQAAREHAFNPVTEYLDRCKSMWDGTARVANAFTTYWGGVDSEYLRLVATMFFIGIVVRGYRPGVKHDLAPVFEGGQGRGKSTALKILGGDWFADTPFKMGEKDGYLSIQGVLLYEVAELEQFNRSEVTAIKAFMSSTTDRFREPYGRRMKNMPRRCAFGATTNEDQYFKDTTGNRRFLPVATGTLDLDGLNRDRDQLFGEAIHMLDAGVLWYPTRDQQERLIDQHQESREIPDPWVGKVYEYVENLDEYGNTIGAGPLQRVTVRQLLTKGLGHELSKLGPAKLETMRVSAIMRKLGWIKGRDAHGARERFYARPGSLDANPSTGEDDDLPF